MRKQTGSRKNLPRRLLSGLLVFSVVMGMVVLGGSTVANAASPEIFFLAPETIYLTPNAAAGTPVAMQWFIDQEPDSFTSPTGYTLRTAQSDGRPQTDGIVYFYCPGATQVSVKCLDPGVTPTLWTGGANSTTGVDTDLITGAAQMGNRLAYYISNQATATNTSRLITWEATYVVGGITSPLSPTATSTRLIWASMARYRRARFIEKVRPITRRTPARRYG